jgi:ribosomal protein S18 acetylase RimI-like enzyme
MPGANALTADVLSRRGSDATITLRPIRTDDRDFLLSLYASTRERELATVSWDDQQKAMFVRMQFEAQHAQYQEHYADASFDVIVLDDRAIGRLYVKRAESEIRIVDIALVPDHCNRGIGTMLLKQLQSEAAAAGKPLRIHVERFNLALRLYERLGFQPIADRGVYLFMEWQP